MHERIDDATTDEMDQRRDDATTEKGGAPSRRAVIKGAAVSGLAALFTAAGAGSALAQDEDQNEDQNEDLDEDQDENLDEDQDENLDEDQDEDLDEDQDEDGD